MNKSAGAAEHSIGISAEGENFADECPGCDIKRFDGEVPVMLELWEMQSTPSMQSLPGPLWPGDLEPDRVLFRGQIELNYALRLDWIVWNKNV